MSAQDLAKAQMVSIKRPENQGLRCDSNDNNENDDNNKNRNKIHFSVKFTQVNNECTA